MRPIGSPLAFSTLLLVTMSGSCDGADPKLVALDAIAKFVVERDYEAVRKHVHPAASKGNGEPGSAIAFFTPSESEEKRLEATAEHLELGEVVFFRKEQIALLEKDFPDPLWQRVKIRIGDMQGVLFTTRTTGKHSITMDGSSHGIRYAALFVLILDNADQPRIVHLDVN